MRFLARQPQKRVWFLALLSISILFPTLAFFYSETAVHIERVDRKVEQVTQSNFPVFSTDDAYRLILAAYVINCDKAGAEAELATREEYEANFIRSLSSVQSGINSAEKMLSDFKKEHTTPLRNSFTAAYDEYCSVAGKLKRRIYTN